MMNLKYYGLQKKLETSALPSGFEGVHGAQADVISDLAKSMGYTCTFDALGNLYCRKGMECVAADGRDVDSQPATDGVFRTAGVGLAADGACRTTDAGSAAGLMIAAAMDVKGFLTTHVWGDKVWFNPIGPLKADEIVDRPVRFENGMRGMIRHKHHAEGMEAEKKKDCRLEDLYILIDDGEEDMVSVGDAAVLDIDAKLLDDGKIQAAHAENLAACMVILEAMEALKDSQAVRQVTFVFLAQYWSGRMGIRAAVQNVQPHTCLLCGTSEALDDRDSRVDTQEAAALQDAANPKGAAALQDAADPKDAADPEHPVDLVLGGGPAIRFREKLQASDEQTCKTLIAAADAAGVTWQGEARNREQSGALEAMVSGSRIGVCYLGVPVRDRGTVKAVYRLKDVEDCVKVLMKFI